MARTVSSLLRNGFDTRNQRRIRGCRNATLGTKNFQPLMDMLVVSCNAGQMKLFDNIFDGCFLSISQARFPVAPVT